jgi:HSP20 family molecular chaperone IbpA
MSGNTFGWNGWNGSGWTCIREEIKRDNRRVLELEEWSERLRQHRQLTPSEPETVIECYLDEKDDLLYKLELPGVKKQDIIVKSAAHLINVSWKKKGVDKHCQFQPRDGYDASSLRAKHEDGVLTITISLSEDYKPRAHLVE